MSTVRARHARRGAAYVEVLVLVGVVVTLGLAAVLALGQGTSAKATAQASCLQSFSCNGGSAGPLDNLGAAVGMPAAVVGTPGQANAHGLVPKPPTLRDAADAASAALADAEDRYEALKASGAPRAELREARAAIRTADAAYTAAGQAVLDEAYGGNYGFWDRQWIDVKNTGPFVGGLAVGTWDGIVSMPSDVANLAGAAYTWATTPSAPRDYVAERNARIAERKQYLDHEVMRVSSDEGAAQANYSDGHYDGKVILSGIVVGEGAGILLKGGTAAIVAGTRTTKAAEATVDVIANAQKGERLGEGTFSVAYKHGDTVQKVIKSEITVGAGTRALTQAEREMLAAETTAFTNEVGQALGKGIVPPLQDLGSGVLQQPFVSGKTLSEVLLAGDMAAYDAALAAKDAAIWNASKAIGLEGYHTGTLANGWNVMVDANPANFRFAADGKLVSWFDPIAIFPP